MAKAVHHKQGLRMDEIRNFKAHLAHADARGVQNAHPVTRHKPGGPGPFRMYPGGIFRHLLQQQGVVDGMPLGVHGGPAKGNAKSAGRRRRGGRIGLQHVQAGLGPVARAGQLNLAGCCGEL